MSAGDRELDGGARLAADGHHPAHHSGSFSAWPRWADDLLAADPGDAAARPASRTAGACWRSPAADPSAGGGPAAGMRRALFGAGHTVSRRR